MTTTIMRSKQWSSITSTRKTWSDTNIDHIVHWTSRMHNSCYTVHPSNELISRRYFGGYNVTTTVNRLYRRCTEQALAIQFLQESIQYSNMIQQHGIRKRCYRSIAACQLDTKFSHGASSHPEKVPGKFVRYQRETDNEGKNYYSTKPSDTSASSSLLTDSLNQKDRSELPKIKKPIFLPNMYRLLQLELFTKDEIEEIFDRIVQHQPINNQNNNDNNESNINYDEVKMTLDSLEEFLFHRIQALDMTMENVNDSNNSQDESYMSLLLQSQRNHARYEAVRIMSRLSDGKSLQTSFTKDAFCKRIISIGSAIDIQSSIPIATSMLFVGSSVGIMTPAMPFVIENLHLTATEYGMVVSAFALAKLIGNIPAAIAVEEYGRKPFMVYSLVPLMGIAVAGIGYSTSFGELFTCRLLAGAGVAALSTAGTLMITDLSTPLNRASTLAPIMSAFAAGTALGPALGGMLVDTIGLHWTFYSVGLSFFSVGIVNKFLLQETKQSQYINFPWSKEFTKMATINEGTTNNGSQPQQSRHTAKEAMYEAVSQWLPLLQNKAIRNVMIMNGIYWVALAGSQMTLLPLLLTTTAADGGSFAMTASQVGQVYMGMSCVQFVGNPIFAKISDRLGGQAPAIIGGCTLIGSSMAILPMTSTVPQLAATLAVWSAGSSMLSTAPIAYISDAVTQNKAASHAKHDTASHDASSADTEHHHSSTNSTSTVARAQAIALLRTCGDVGFLFGAAGIGALADYTNSVEIAMQGCSFILLSATSWFAITKLRSIPSSKSSLSQSKSSAVPVSTHSSIVNEPASIDSHCPSSQPNQEDKLKIK